MCVWGAAVEAPWGTGWGERPPKGPMPVPLSQTGLSSEGPVPEQAAGRGVC